MTGAAGHDTGTLAPISRSRIRCLARCWPRWPPAITSDCSPGHRRWPMRTWRCWTGFSRTERTRSPGRGRQADSRGFHRYATAPWRGRSASRPRRGVCCWRRATASARPRTSGWGSGLRAWVRPGARHSRRSVPRPDCSQVGWRPWLPSSGASRTGHGKRPTLAAGGWRSDARVEAREARLLACPTGVYIRRRGRWSRSREYRATARLTFGRSG